ncbi:hypothetical protein ACNOYE_21255 [Nannocystaceae bacterium ST9]
MLERSLLLIASLIASGCPTEVEPQPRPAVERADEPSAEPSPPGPAGELEIVTPIEPVDGLISGRGLPQHVDFSLANANTEPLRVVLTGVEHVDQDGGERRALGVGEIQWWTATAVAPKILKLDEPLELAAGEFGQLTVYLGAWPQAAIDAGQVDARADSYRLIGAFTVDGVANDVTVVIRRSAARAALPSR